MQLIYSIAEAKREVDRARVRKTCFMTLQQDAAGKHLIFQFTSSDSEQFIPMFLAPSKLSGCPLTPHHSVQVYTPLVRKSGQDTPLPQNIASSLWHCFQDLSCVQRRCLHCPLPAWVCRSLLTELIQDTPVNPHKPSE